jgi:hypothetical protein
MNSQSLRLDYNSMVGSEGCSNICRGLRSNQTLKQLHLPFCDIGPEVGCAFFFVALLQITLCLCYLASIVV